MHKPYPSDLNDTQWQLVENILPLDKQIGRPRKHNLRAIVDAILYQEKTSCSWRMLPHDLPPWQTVYDYYSRWRQDGTWQSILTLITTVK